MENINDIRLQFLIKNFRQTPRAKKGYRDLSRLITSGDEKKLFTLLRNHWKEPINEEAEVTFRDNADFLIGFYSLLEVGLITGYISNAIARPVFWEARNILSNQAVKNYYKNDYQLYLPQLLLKQINDIVHGSILHFPESNEQTVFTFERFLQLYRSRINDSDIDIFLWFLDDGYQYDSHNYEYIGISDLWNLLKNYQSIKEKNLILISPKSILNKALMGFVKFISYLDELEDLIKNYSEDELTKSAFWHIESYWFSHLRNKLGDVLKEGIEITRDIVIRTDIEITDDISKEDIEEWKNEARVQIEKSINSINYLFNDNLGKPLIRLLNLDRLT